MNGDARGVAASAQSGGVEPSADAYPGGGDAAAPAAGEPLAAGVVPAAATAAGPSSAAAAGSAAPPAPAGSSAAGAAAAAAAARPPSLAAAADAAEQLLTALRQEGERAGYTLRGAPDAQLQAAVTAVRALLDVALADCTVLVPLLKTRSGLWAAVAVVYVMALRDMERHDLRTQLLFALCYILGLVSKASATAPRSASVRPRHKRDAAVKMLARLVLGLVRADALQVHARDLAQQHQQLRTAVKAGEEAPQEGGPTVIAAMGQARAAAGAAVNTLQAMASPLVQDDCSDEVQGLLRQLQVALIRALHASNVLEHLARLRMELQQAEHLLWERFPEEADSASDDVARLDESVSCLLQGLDYIQPHIHEGSVDGDQVFSPTWALASPCLRLLGGADGLDGAPLLLQLRSLARQPCLQLYAGWRLAAHLCNEADAQLFGMPDSLMPVFELSEEERLASVRNAAVLWSWALWAPPDVSGADGGAAVQGSASQPLPPLPYTPVHMVRLLCGALPAGDDAIAAEVRESVALVCYRALLHQPMSLAEAEAMLREVWPVLVATLRGPSTAAIASRLLRLAHGAAATLAPAASSTLPLPLRCALEAGLLRGLEGCLRRAGQAVSHERTRGEHDGALRAATGNADLLLRRPGAWPAVLAHAPPRQVAALVVTLRKLLVVAIKHDQPRHVLCRYHLVALLEQAAAVLCAEPSSANSHAACASGEVNLMGAAVMSSQSLRLNQQGRDAIDLCDGDAARAPPCLAQLARLGGCPAPGSPAAQQQRALAVFAAAQWLPELLVDAQAGGLKCLALPLSSHRFGPPMIVWLGVVVQECLHARWAAAEERRQQQDGGPHCSGSTAAGSDGGGAAAPVSRLSASAAYSSWRQLFAADSNLVMLLLSWLRDRAADAAQTEPLYDAFPAHLLEGLMAAVPEAIADLLNSSFAALTADGPAATRTQRFLQRHGRPGLWAALRRLGKVAQMGGLPSDWQPPEQLLAEAPHLRPPSPGSAAACDPLPPPCEAASVLPLCSYPSCTVLDGESEADATLRACARCRAARYCSPACQRAHWAAGHKAECAGGSARG